MGYVDNMAARTVEDLRDYASRYIVGKPYVAGIILSPQARTALNLVPDDLLAGSEAR